MPKVSIITPVYNGEKYLEETIVSVLNQTFTDFEYLIINHASTDSSRDIIQKFQATDNRIKLIELSVNKGGPAYPRNEGMRVAQGEFLTFIDADDLWKPYKLQTQIDFFTAHDTLDMIYSNCDNIDENGIFLGKSKPQLLKYFLSLFMKTSHQIYYANFINVNTLMIKNSNLTWFNEDPFLIAIEDWMFHIRNFQIGKKVHYFDEALIQYRLHTSSLSNRLTDKSYRKIYYMLSLLFLESNISFVHFILANTLNSIKLLRRKFTIARSNK
jgi:glycosyltransferase involved in cell wall biosynthesis